MDVYKSLSNNQANRERRMYPETMIRGKRYVLTDITQEQSKFASSKGGIPLKTVVHFESNSFKFFMYMGVGYDNLSNEVFNTMKTDIANGKPPAVVMYGKIGSANELYILGHDEEVNQDTLHEVQGIEEVEKQNKRQLDSGEASPSPKKSHPS